MMSMMTLGRLVLALVVVVVVLAASLIIAPPPAEASSFEKASELAEYFCENYLGCA